MKLDNWLYAEEEIQRPLTVVVKQEPSRYVISLVIPGHGSKDLEIYSLADSLVVLGKLTEKTGRSSGVSTEQRRSIFYQWTYPKRVRFDQITAVVRDGSLTLNVPIDVELNKVVQTIEQPPAVRQSDVAIA